MFIGGAQADTIGGEIIVFRDPIHPHRSVVCGSAHPDPDRPVSQYGVGLAFRDPQQIVGIRGQAEKAILYLGFGVSDLPVVQAGV